MSLKAFHVVFIVASTLLVLGFGLWSANAYAEGGGSAYLAAAGGAFAAGTVLVAYSRWFVRKLKDVSYL